MKQSPPNAVHSPRERDPRLAERVGDTPLRPTVRAAFTLVELLICVVIMAIAAAVVVPSVNSAATMSLESAGRIIAADLRYAASLSVQYNTQYTVRFDVANNAYDLVLTGTGSPPPLRNPSAPPGDAAGTYHVAVDQLSPTPNRGTTARLLGAALKDSGQPVTDITFMPVGGTGPSRSQDTVVWISEGAGAQTRYLRLTVSWVTGQVWIDEPNTFAAGWSG